MGWMKVIDPGLSKIIVGSIVENSLLHFQPIRVGVECLIVVEIMSLEFSHNLKSIKQISWDAVEINIKLGNFQILIQCYMYLRFLLDLLSSPVQFSKVENHFSCIQAFKNDSISHLAVR